MILFENICIGIALAVLVLFILLAIRFRRTATKRFSLVLVGICVSSFFLSLPRYWDTSLALFSGWHPGQEGSWFHALRTVAYSLFYSLKAVGGGQEVDVLEELEIESPVFRTIYIVLNYGYFVVAPLITSGLVLSLIGDLWDRIRYRIQVRRNYYVFSGMNDISINLARQLRDKYPEAVIVFCQSRSSEKKLLIRARNMDALLLNAPCEALRIPFGKKRLEYYLVDPEEDGNLRIAELLISRYREEDKCRVIINAFVASGTGIQVVESMDKGNVGMRFIDGTALLCNNLLLNHPLSDGGTGTVSVVIIGCDRTGLRMLKTVSWCGQLEGKKLKIRVYDREASAVEQRFLAQCPELKESCDILFHTADVGTAGFGAILMDPELGSPDATFCVIAMGDDDVNMEAAEQVFRLYRSHNRFGRTPEILTRVRASSKSAIYTFRDNPYLATRNIHTFGGVADVLSTSTLFHTRLERMAFAVDLSYGNLLPEQDPSRMTVEELKAYLALDAVAKSRNDFLHSEYSRRSSMATAVHIAMQIRGTGVMPEDEWFPSDETARRFEQALAEDPGLLERLARNEHLRWNSFMRSEGFCSASWEDLLDFYPQVMNNQDALSKRHLCLTDWDSLDELNRKYLELNPPKRKDFKKSDFDIVRNIPRIIMLTNRLEATGADLDI